MSRSTAPRRSKNTPRKIKWPRTRDKRPAGGSDFTGFGINAAHSGRTSRSISWSAVKQTKDKESNSMLNAINKRRGGFTLVEIMIVVAIIALLAAIAVPGFLRARKRSQASRILNDLRMIDSACDQYAIETNRTSGATVTITDWTNYLKKGSLLYNSGNSLLGSAYGTQEVDIIPTVPPNDYATLSDVARSEERRVGRE